ncbi:MAG TPA: SurA N-terminal domain-containing protein [Candidatus Acidoferrum sp.]|nr:SurA N-terminal domain-containing protein [Candidatus Acidoferrum sp.]
MLDALRKRQRTLLIIITVVTIITFIVFLNPSSRMRGGPQSAIGKINGRSISLEDVQKLSNVAELAYGLGLIDLVRHLMPGQNEARTRDEETLGFAWNLLLLRDEAKALQVEPSDNEIRNAEKNLPAFQTDGHFDQEKYRKFTIIGSIRGFTPADIDNVVADNIRVQDVYRLVTAASPIPDSMLRHDYELGQSKMNLAVLSFKAADYKDNHDFSDAAVNSYYQDHQYRYELPEKRKIEFIAFTLSDNQKKLADKEKQAVLKSLADNAEAFQQDVSEHPDDFDNKAKQKDLKVEQTGMFTNNDPDPLIAKESGLVTAANNLSKEQPVTDVIQGADGFYVAKLVEVDPVHAAPLADVRGQVVAAMKADAVHADILKEMKGGATFLDAAKKASVTPETPPAFSLVDVGQQGTIAKLISENNLELSPDDTTDVLSQGQDSVFVHLLSREPIDDAKFAEYKKTNSSAIEQYYGGLVFKEWLSVALQKAGGSPLARYQSS